MALGAGALAAAAGWVLVAGLTLLGWLTARAGELSDVFTGATQMWLLAHGGGLQIGGIRWTLIPLGVTAILALVIAAVSSATAHRMIGDDDEPDVRQLFGNLLRVVAVTGTAYALTVVAVAILAGSVTQGGRTAIGAGVLALLGTTWGAGRGLGLKLADVLPAWAQPLPAATAAATWVVLLGGAVALTMSVIKYEDRIAGIAGGLGADATTTVAMAIAQLLFLPNLVIWAGAWTLGAGFTFGQDSVVSPPSTDLGLLPSIPVLGALPAEGPGDWLLLWLATGVVAGALGATVVLNRRRQAGAEEVALVSALAGLLSAGVLVLLGLAAGGNLGVERLTDLGPRIPELAVLSSALLGMSGLLSGLIAGLVRQILLAWRTGAGPGPDKESRAVGSEE